MNTKKIPSLCFTDAAVNRVKYLLIKEENSYKKFRIYITGGGCGGFQYGFTFDNKIHEHDFVFKRKGVEFVVDAMSFQYLVGGSIDYIEELSGSRFIVINPNAKTTCSCGSSFSV